MRHDDFAGGAVLRAAVLARTARAVELGGGRRRSSLAAAGRCSCERRESFMFK